MREGAKASLYRAIASSIRRTQRWLMEPGTIRIVGPAGFLVGIALVAAGLALVQFGGDDAGPANPGSERGQGSDSGAVFFQGAAYPVPPHMVDAYRSLVPPVQPAAGFNLVIDALGLNAKVVRLGLTPDNVPQVPNDGRKVAWYEFTAKPGTGGNAVLAAHVRWAGDPGAFADLAELEDGDLMRLEWDDGGESVYEVFDSLVVDVKKPDSLRVMAPTRRDTLTLITCGGTFVADRDNPLGGDFTKRTVVQAHLVESSVAASSR